MQLGQAWARPAGPELQKGLFEVTPWGCPKSVPNKEQRSRHAGRSPAGSPGSMEGPRGTHSTPSAGLGRTEGSGRRPGLVMAAPWAERNGGLGTQAEAKLCPSQVPVAHCFGPRGLYKRRFCSVCRKGLEALGLRCEGTASIPRGPAPGAWSLRPGRPRPSLRSGRRSGVGGGEVGAGRRRAAPCVQRWAGRRDAEKLVPIVPGAGVGVGGVPVSHHGPPNVQESEVRGGADPGPIRGRAGSVRSDQRPPNPARPPVCELHVHPDCVPFACSDCRQCHQDGHREHVSARGLGEAGERAAGRAADGALRRTHTSTTGGRGPCRRVLAASSVGRRAAPRTCRPACAASGVASRWAHRAGPLRVGRGLGGWRGGPRRCSRTESWVLGTARLDRAAFRPLAVEGRLGSLVGGARCGSSWPSAPEPRARAAPAPLQAHSVCSAALAPECTFGRLRTLVLPPACVRLLSRNFSKMHCFRIPEIAVPEPGEPGDGEGRPARGWALTKASCDPPTGDGEDSADGSVPAGPGREVGAPESGKCPFAVPAPTPRTPLPRPSLTPRTCTRSPAAQASRL